MGPRRLLDERAAKLRSLGQTTPEGREAARREVRELQELQRTLARSLGDLRERLEERGLGDLRERLEERGLPKGLHLPPMPQIPLADAVRDRVHFDPALPTVEWARAELVERAVRLSARRVPGESAETTPKPDRESAAPAEERRGTSP